jgi:hypothetical protein
MIKVPGTLPIEPTLSPELGVAGGVLILAGLIYGLIGLTSVQYVSKSSEIYNQLLISIAFIHSCPPDLWAALQSW